MGLTSLRLIYLNTLRLHLCGPGDYDLEAALPPGTERFQGELAPSGHLVLPCGEFGGLDAAEQDGRLDIGADLALPVVSNRSSSSGQ